MDNNYMADISFNKDEIEEGIIDEEIDANTDDEWIKIYNSFNFIYIDCLAKTNLLIFNSAINCVSF